MPEQSPSVSQRGPQDLPATAAPVSAGTTGLNQAGGLHFFLFRFAPCVGMQLALDIFPRIPLILDPAMSDTSVGDSVYRFCFVLIFIPLFLLAFLAVFGAFAHGMPGKGRPLRLLFLNDRWKRWLYAWALAIPVMGIIDEIFVSIMHSRGLLL